MKLQFNGEITDIQALKNELKNKGLDILSIEISRWLGKDEQGNHVDRGGRIDIEVSDDHLLESKKPITFDIQIAMIESDKTTIDGDVQELKKEKEKHKKKLKETR